MSPTPAPASTAQRDPFEEIKTLDRLLENIKNIRENISKRQQELSGKLIADLKSGQPADLAAMTTNMFRRWKELQTKKKELEEQDAAFEEMQALVQKQIDASDPELLETYKQIKQVQAAAAKATKQLQAEAAKATKQLQAEAANATAADRAPEAKVRGGGKGTTQKEQTGASGAPSATPDRPSDQTAQGYA